MKNVFLFGYYGYDNLGDDLILKSIINTFSGEFKFKVLTYNYEKTNKIENLTPVSRLKFFNIIHEIFISDVVASGGGSLLQDATSSKSLYFYLGLIFLGEVFQKKTIFLFNGIGPINGYFNRKLVKWVLKRVDRIILRDYQSFEFLKTLGLNKNIEVVGDAVFLSDYKVTKTYEEKRSSKLVIISLRPWKNYNELKINETRKMIKYLKENGYSVELLPLMQPDDYKLLKSLEIDGEVTIIDSLEDEMVIFKKIEEAHLLIGERLHSLIISSICETPFLSIEYDPKIAGFTKMVKQVNALKTENYNHKLIIESLELLEINYEKYYIDLKLEKNNIKSELEKCIESINYDSI
ncbi:polysaccharide pyruvyl transferase CsaB [Clostridiaceae bacterium HSG29]|nr:polysaccharide pyruvyl transferase CsaB [Clostridiaceae bacterium HSG29]